MKQNKPQTITVLGDGAFGTAFATLLAHNGHTVHLWCHNPEVAIAIAAQHTNSKFLPDIELSENIIPTTSLKDALANDIIFEAIPVQFMRSVLEQCKPYAKPSHRWIVLSKGIENDTLLLPTEIIKNTVDPQAVTAVVCGPSYARELALQQPTGLCVGTTTQELNDKIRTLLKNSFVYCEPSDDIFGTQIAAALKNVIALAMGLLEGAGYDSNAQALLMVRALQELKTVLHFVQSDENTLYGLAGVGDLVLTSFGNKSRNHHVGVMLGQGKNLATVLKETSSVPEGINTLKSLQQLILTHNLKLPIMSTIYEVVIAHKHIQNLIKIVCN
jgi:glycerol-3-phosphate dehydrogenase (NAD(P)+)